MAQIAATPGADGVRLNALQARLSLLNLVNLLILLSTVGAMVFKPTI
jgi:hypothetical protein